MVLAFPIHVLVLVAFAACGTVPKRNPLPESLAAVATVPGLENVRYWADEVPALFDEFMSMSEDELEASAGGIMDREHNYLAISGGGQNGAFGAGLIVGWTEAGTRPEFISVTGISTGALIAPFAFLGPEYDRQIEELYTSFSTDDLFRKRGLLRILGSDAMMTTEPLAEKIAAYYDQDVMEAIAVEHRRGRQLLIGTTNLDAGRGVTWNITRIAASGAPGALDLIHEVILASCSIPVVFSPVLIDVEANGQIYDEIHVDGGTHAQVIWYSSDMDWNKVAERLRVQGRPKLYLIRNARLAPIWKTTRAELSAIAKRTVDSMVRTQGIGDLYRIYLQTQRDGVEFLLARIPADFEHESKEEFDVEHMRPLFARGREMARAGYPWMDAPEGFDPH